MIPIGIVAHIHRIAMAEHLAITTAASHISYDDGALGCDLNHQQVWQHHADTAGGDWSVVLEDDAIPVGGFLAQLDRALEVAPTPIVSLYLGTSRPLGGWQQCIKQAVTAIQQTSACWITSDRLLHAVGVAIRTPLIPSLLETLDTARPIDEAISAWAQTNAHTIGYCWPSILDHADVPTLVNHADGKPRGRERVAWCAAPRHAWNGQHIAMTSPYTRSR